MNTLTHTNIQSVWPQMQAKSCRVPSIPEMVTRRLNGQRAATKVMIRYIPYSQDELDAVVDALIEATKPEPAPVVVTSHVRTETTRSHMRSDALFIVSMFVAVGLGVWALTQWVSAPIVTVVITLAAAVAAFAAFAFTATRMIHLRLTN